jgi:hypothetical protein
MITLFLATTTALLAAAAGLAIGALRGRPLRAGCAVRSVSDDPAAACVGCAPVDSLRRDIAPRGV